MNIDSLAPNALMKQQLISLNYDLVKPEYTYGDSRIDFYMERNGEKFLTEVKGCTLADDLHPGTGLFPDAPTERGVKHLHELAKAAKEGYHCAIAFVIQMNGIHRVLPNEEKQPEFKEALVNAAKAGVQVALLQMRGRDRQHKNCGCQLRYFFIGARFLYTMISVRLKKQ